MLRKIAFFLILFLTNNFAFAAQYPAKSGIKGCSIVLNRNLASDITRYRVHFVLDGSGSLFGDPLVEAQKIAYLLGFQLETNVEDIQFVFYQFDTNLYEMSFEHWISTIMGGNSDFNAALESLNTQILSNTVDGQGDVVVLISDFQGPLTDSNGHAIDSLTHVIENNHSVFAFRSKTLLIKARMMNSVKYQQR